MQQTSYDPITGTVTINGKQYGELVRVNNGHHRMRTTEPVIEYLVENGHFPNDVAAGKAIRAAGSFKLSAILEASSIPQKARVLVTCHGGKYTITHIGSTKVFETRLKLIAYLNELLESLED